jgi:hypothetical protein
MVDFKQMFSNTGVKVIGGDLAQGEWKYETGILWGAFDQIQMQGQVKSIALQTEESIKKLPEMAAWGLAGSMLLGPVGLLAGVLMGGNKKQVCALCELKDGRKFLATMDSKVFQELLGMSLTKS